MSEKTGLVLEGGGVRGAFTAGACKWLADNGIRFDYSVGISSGAVYQTCYELGDTETMEKICCKYACSKDAVGIQALLHEGYYVAYKKLFREDLLGKEHFSVRKLREENRNMEIGCYDLEQGKTIFFNASDLDDQMELLRASCSLPIAAPIVDFKGHRLLDGGITKMIPIERAVEQGCTKTVIITTKPKDYVRKPASLFVKILMHIVYPQYPAVLRDYKVRHLNYYKQIGLINQLVEEKKAVMIYPSRTIKVSRWKGDPEKCRELFELGYQDMEARRDEIMRIVGTSPASQVILPKEKVKAEV